MKVLARGLHLLQSNVTTTPLQPPLTLMERQWDYSIIFNMAGVEQRNIGIDIHPTKRRIQVLAKRSATGFRRAFSWEFDVPKDGLIYEASAKLDEGFLEIVVPKRFRSLAA